MFPLHTMCLSLSSYMSPKYTWCVVFLFNWGSQCTQSQYNYIRHHPYTCKIYDILAKVAVLPVWGINVLQVKKNRRRAEEQTAPGSIFVYAPCLCCGISFMSIVQDQSIRSSVTCSSSVTHWYILVVTIIVCVPYKWIIFTWSHAYFYLWLNMVLNI